MSEKKLELDYKVIFKYGLILLIIAMVCTALLALTNMVTAPVIQLRSEEADSEAKQIVLPDADSFEPLDDIDEIKTTVTNDGGDGEIIDSVDIAYRGDEVVGYAVKTLPNGYGGEITMLTGIDSEGQVSGISVLEQSETAGLGARSTEAEFQEQFQGLSAEEDVLVEKSGTVDGNEIQAISGATITSTAVATGVNTAMDAVNVVEELNE